MFKKTDAYFFFCLAAVGVFLLCPPDAARSEIYGKFLGRETCAQCHEDTTSGWRQTPHAHAYQTLKDCNQHELPACLQCHVVGYDIFGGFIDGALTPELAGVQCESCHGPGLQHVESPDAPPGIIASPDASVCRKCHTKGQDSKFDFEEKVRSVHGKGPLPATNTNNKMKR